MRDYDRETAFLMRMISYDDKPESRHIQKAIARAQQDHACALRAVWTVGLLAIFSGILSQAEFFQSAPAIRLRIVCVATLTGAICLVTFITVFVFYRLRLNRLREDCRRVIGGIIETQAARQEENRSLA